MVQIIPAILATTEKEYQERVNKLRSSKLAKDLWVQIDFIDNKFVQNQTIGPEVVIDNPIDNSMEVQLMAKYPESWIDLFIKAGVKRIVFPAEDKEGISERIGHIRNHGVEVGLSVNPETSLDTLAPFIANIDLVLIMSVHPGFSGQQFISASIDKIKSVKERGWPVTIEVDGGITENLVKTLAMAGADNLVMGSHLFEGNLDENIQKIQKSFGN